MTTRSINLPCLVALLLIPTLCTASAAEPPWQPTLQTFLDQAAETLEVPGAVVLVVSRDKGVQIMTHGVLRANEGAPVTPRTSFALASLTKAFTATTAAVEVGEGTISWDTRAQALIPELELSDPMATKRVTLRDLLAHRSGLGDFNDATLNVDAGPEWLLPRLALFEPAAEFRDQFVYSGLGYTVAGLMIGRAENLSWAKVVEKRLLRPLGMRSTTVGPPHGPPAEVAGGHIRVAGLVRPIEQRLTSVSSPAIGLWSTADDMARWLQLLVRSGELDGRQIVSKKALQETWTPQVVMRRSGSEVRAYGLGWHVSSWHDHRFLSHDGGGVGFTSTECLFPDDGVAIAVLANVAVTALPDIVSERARELVLGEPKWKGLIEGAKAMSDRIEAFRAASARALRKEKKTDAPPTLSLSEYAGCYENTPFGRIEIDWSGNGLTASFHDMPLSVEHLHGDVYLFSGDLTGDWRVVVKIEDGVVTSLTVPLGKNPRARVFTKVPGPCSRTPAPGLRSR